MIREHMNALGRSALFLSAACALFGNVARAEECRSEVSEPHWFAHDPEGHAFAYVVGHGQSTRSPEEAQEQAVGSALKTLATERGVTVSAETRLQASINQQAGGAVTESSSASSDVRLQADELKVQGAETVGIYPRTCGSLFRSSVLVRLKRPRAIGVRTPWITPVWHGAVLPGWGQFTNDQPGKGWLFAGTMAVTIPTAIGAMIYSQTQAASITGNTPRIERDVYSMRSDVGYGIAVTAGTVALTAYLASLIDAAWFSGSNTYE